MSWVRALPLLLAFAALAACRGEDPGPTTGSETHFLSWCSSDGSCDDGLSCLCGVCTEACSATSECAEFGRSAECLAVADKPADQACPNAPVAAACEAACAEDADCASLGEEVRCDRGFCRRLADDCAEGQIAAREVVFIGDTFFGDSHEIPAELERLARSTGALDAGESYRDYSSSLITPFGGGADLASQFTTARAEGAVRVAIVTVGGPDIVLPGSCPEPPDGSCPAIQNAITGAEALFQRMADDGVAAIVNVFYPDTLDASLNARLAALRPPVRATCDSSPVPCHFIDLAPTFAGRSDTLLIEDGINPSTEGAVASAAVIWSAMQRLCLAQ